MTRKEMVEALKASYEGREFYKLDELLKELGERYKIGDERTQEHHVQAVEKVIEYLENNPKGMDNEVLILALSSVERVLSHEVVGLTPPVDTMQTEYQEQTDDQEQTEEQEQAPQTRSTVEDNDDQEQDDNAEQRAWSMRGKGRRE